MSAQEEAAFRSAGWWHDGREWKAPAAPMGQWHTTRRRGSELRRAIPPVIGIVVAAAIAVVALTHTGGTHTAPVAASSSQDDSSDPGTAIPDDPSTDQPAAPSPAFTTAPPPPAETGGTGSDLASQYIAWATGGGSKLLDSLTGDLSVIQTASADPSDASGVADACAALGVDVEAAQNYDPLPDPAAQAEWSSALDSFASAASDCTQGADNLDAQLLEQSASEITAGSGYLDAVTADVEKVG